MDDKVILLNYTGKRGGGALDAYEMVKALLEKGYRVAALLSKEIENYEEWRKLDLEKIIFIDTYNTKVELFLNTLLFPIRQKRVITRETSDLNISFIYYPMISLWNPLINRCFKGYKKCLVVHDPCAHEGENGLFSYFSRDYKNYDILLVHTKKFLKFVRDKYEKPTYFIPLGRHNFYKSCSNKKTLINYDNDKINFLFFGRISKYKGLDLLAEAYERLTNNVEIDTSLTVIGNGNFSEYEKAYSNLKNITIINRWIRDEEVESVFLGDNIVCVCPYRRASQSGVIYVAMDYGVSIIASDSGGISEQIDDGRNGLLFTEGSVDELYDKMYEVATNSELRRMLGRNAREEVQFMTWDESAKQLMDIMREF